MYNVLQSNDQKAEFEAWASHEYPSLWREMQRRPKRPDQDGIMKIKIIRPWKA